VVRLIAPSDATDVGRLKASIDPSLIVPGSLTVRRDVPEAEAHLLDGGCSALDEKLNEIA
jgi:hypothetical protein